MRIRNAIIAQLGIMLLLYGCMTPEPPSLEMEEADAMLHLGETLRPEILLFPEYLLMVDFEIDQHGRIPGSSVVGADLKTKLDLKTTMVRFNEVLAAQGWNITQQDVAERSFRMLAATGGESLEIRAVQGSGPTQVFLLYQPGPGPLL